MKWNWISLGSKTLVFLVCLFTSTAYTQDKFIATTHFFISFSPTVSDEAYVKRLSQYLETSWKKYIEEWKFRRPSWTNSYRIQVFLAKDLKVGTMDAAGVVYGSFDGKHNPYMKIRAGLSESVLKDTSAHEMFHIIQYGYDIREAPWLLESTATAIQDEIFPEGRSYIDFSSAWYQLWSSGEPLNSTRDLFEYGTSIFFKYLMENFSGEDEKRESLRGVYILKKIWEHAGSSSGDNAIKAIQKAIGGPYEKISVFENAFLDFSTALYIKNGISKYSFKRGSEILADLSTDLQPSSYYYKSFDRSNGKIMPGNLKAARWLTSHYLELRPQSDMYHPKPLFLTIENRMSGPLVFRAISYSLFGKEIKVYDGFIPTAERFFTFKIDHFGGYEDSSIRKVILVIGNPVGATEQYRIRYAVGAPPYLKEIKIKGKSQKTLYHARWSSADKKTLVPLTQNIIEDDVEKEHPFDVELTFSQALSEAPTVVFGEKTAGRSPWYYMNYQKEVWKGTFGLPFLGKGEKELPIIVSAKDYKGDFLDSDPKSTPEPFQDIWASYDGNVSIPIGGDDKNHKLIFKKKAIAGSQSIVLLVDASGSMKDNNKIINAKKAAIDAVSNMRGDDEAAIWVFLDCWEIKLLQEFTKDKAKLKSIIQSLKTGAGTPLAKGILDSGNYLFQKAQYETKRLIVLSDGEETCGGNPQAAAQDIFHKGLLITFGNELFKEDKPLEIEEKDLPMVEEPKLEIPPCDVGQRRSFGAEKTPPNHIKYTVVLFSIRPEENDCKALLKEEIYGVYRGKAVNLETGKKRLGWGINSRPSSQRLEEASFKKDPDQFKALVAKGKLLPKDNAIDVFRKIDAWVHEELKP